MVDFRIVWCWAEERDGQRLNSRYPLPDMNLRTPRREIGLLRVQLRRSVRGTLKVEAVFCRNVSSPYWTVRCYREDRNVKHRRHDDIRSAYNWRCEFNILWEYSPKDYSPRLFENFLRNRHLVCQSVGISCVPAEFLIIF